MTKKITNLQIPLHKFTYTEFLEKAIATGWKILPVAEGYNITSNDKVMLLGHRVVNNVDKARSMGLIEFSKELNCTYFLLSTSNEMVAEGVYHFNYLFQLNHEVGLLIDCVDVVVRYGFNVHDHIISNLVNLKQFGIPSMGISMYDDSDLAKGSNFEGVNYFFNFSDKEGYLNIQSPMGSICPINFGVHPLAEYGLRYADRTFPCSHTLVDDKGVMSLDGKPLSRKQARDSVFSFLENESGLTMVSFNPDHWNL